MMMMTMMIKVRKTDATGKKLNNSATVQHRITKFYSDIHADLVYSYICYVRLYYTIIQAIAGMAKVCP